MVEANGNEDHVHSFSSDHFEEITELLYNSLGLDRKAELKFDPEAAKPQNYFTTASDIGAVQIFNEEKPCLVCGKLTDYKISVDEAGNSTKHFFCLHCFRDGLDLLVELLKERRKSS